LSTTTPSARVKLPVNAGLRLVDHELGVGEQLLGLLDRRSSYDGNPSPESAITSPLSAVNRQR
jgi:hypothetical protein